MPLAIYASEKAVRRLPEHECHMTNVSHGVNYATRQRQVGVITSGLRHTVWLRFTIALGIITIY